MSTHELPSNIGMYLRLLWVLLLIAVAAAGGYLAGDLSVPDEKPALSSARGTNAARTAAAGSSTEQGLPEDVEVPAWFFARPTPEGDWSTALEEVKLAAAQGINRYAVSVALPWNGAEGVTRILQTLDYILTLSPEARILLDLDLNPPPAWLRTHGEDVVQVDGQLLIYPSMGSRIWLQGVQSALTTLIEGIRAVPAGGHVEGFILGALENGRWYRNGGYDRSPANVEGFRAWLGRHYGEESALQEAWGQKDAGFDSVEVPDTPKTDDPLQVFFTLPDEQRQVDYLRYVSESTADNIAAITAHIKNTVKGECLVLANYGHSLELTESAAGHFALARIMESDLDGFVSPVSYLDRGIGGNGGVMGPVHSACYHGKMWIVVDDTRTGLTRNNATNTVERIKGIRPEDVRNIQLRNFGAALVQGLGIGWMDPEGQGWLQDPDQWAFFGELAAIYAGCLADGAIAFPPVANVVPGPSPAGTSESTTTPANGGDQAAASMSAEGEDLGIHQSLGGRLVVVTDDSSRFYQKAGAVLNNRLLHQVRDAALRSGVPVEFVLLRDVVQGVVPPASVYLFANAFHLPPDERDTLHARLAASHSAAIWLYAPGYFSESPSVQNVCDTVQMQVKAFQKKPMAGSRFLLSGAWVKQNEQIGQEQEWGPLFYISDESVDVVAEYLATDEASIAVKFMENWTSIYVAEPAMTPGLLREVLELLEEHLYFRTTAQPQFDTLYLGHDMLLIHAGKTGDRVLDFGRYCDLVDLVNTDYGWNQKYTFVLEMEAGDSRLLRAYPLETSEISGAEPVPE